MKYLTLIAITPFFCTAAFAQDVDVDKKTGMVTVDGKEAFYLSTKNKVLWQTDYALENLSHEELAYLKAERAQEWNAASHSYQDVTWYSATFSKSSNRCDLSRLTSLNIRKALAKEIAAARLVVDGQVSPDAEQKFVVMHNGAFLKAQNGMAPAAPVVVNVGSPAATSGAKAASISLNEEKIYNNDLLAGTFRSTVRSGVTTITVYNASDAKVATARHTDASDDDWDVGTEGDGKSMHLRYHADKPLMKLFNALAERGLLN